MQTNNKAIHKYTCQMHPEVQKDSPGTCPKCGMTLVPTSGIQVTHDHNHTNHKDHIMKPVSEMS